MRCRATTRTAVTASSAVKRFVDQPCRLSLHVRAEMGDGQDDGGGAIVAERCFLHGGEQRAVKAGQGQRSAGE
ncbi:MAG: hypothetical protein H6638_00145 [Ardenticatenales bacterium]|nr:hypothetical protein [Ardenticatenales bacterium]